MSSPLLDDAIRAAALDVHGATAQDFFDRLTERLAGLLGAQYVLIGKYADAEQSRVRTLSLWAKDTHAPTLIYDLAGSPCSRVIEEECCLFPSGVARLFPEDHLLVEMKIEGYVGIRLLDAEKNPIGILAALFEAAILEATPVQDIIAVFAPRTASELIRHLAEARLENNLTFLRTLLDTIPAPVFSKDREGRFTGCNRAFEEFLGRPAEEILYRTVYDVAPSELAKGYHQSDLELMALGGTQTYESKVRTSEGAERDAIFHKAVIADERGHSDGIIGVITDITTRKRMETELLKLTRAVEQSQASIVITDLEGKIEYANPAACRSTGYALDELLGQNPRVLKSGRMADEEYKILWETIAAGKNWSGEFFNKRKDGSFYWERAVISPVRDDTGRTIRYVAVKEDISAQKEAEREVRDARDFLDKILQATTNGIYVFDTEGRFTSVNEAAVRITGRPREELLGRPFGCLIPEEYLAEVTLFFEDVVKRSLTRSDLEIEIFRPDGGRTPLSISAAPLVADGLLIGLVGTAEDITEKRRAVEERFASMEKEAMLGRLAAVVAHEVNNPLFAIRMQAAALAKALPDKEKEAGRVTLILEQVDRIGRTVKALLGLARRHSANYIELNLVEMIRSVLLLYEVGFISKGIELDLDLPENLPTVRALPDRLQEVIVNLLENARQAIGANGRIGIRAMADGAEIELIIEDTGPGLGENPGRVFKAHYTTKKEGTGIGLAIARRILEEHQGSITAENRPVEEGGGARFRVRLPRYEG